METLNPHTVVLDGVPYSTEDALAVVLNKIDDETHREMLIKIFNQTQHSFTARAMLNVSLVATYHHPDEPQSLTEKLLHGGCEEYNAWDLYRERFNTKWNPFHDWCYSSMEEISAFFHATVGDEAEFIMEDLSCRPRDTIQSLFRNAIVRWYRSN